MRKGTKEHQLLVGATTTIKLLQELKVELGGDMTLDSALSFAIIARSEVCRTWMNNQEFLAELQPRTTTSELKHFSELPKFNFRSDLMNLKELPTDDQFDSLNVSLTSKGNTVAKKVFRSVLRVVGRVKY